MTNHLILQTVILSLSCGAIITILAKRIGLSPIALLLIGGVLLGPSGFAVVQPNSLGSGLSTIVSIAVALILFEGGLTLDYSGYKNSGKVINRLLSIGVVVTWLSIASATFFIFNFDINLSLLTGSLVIVTGPTVIIPLLRRINLEKKLSNILHWEGVLIDPIGVFIAITCFELTLIGNYTSSSFADFLYRMFLGIFIGTFWGFLASFVLRRNWIEKDHINIFSFAIAFLSFGSADLIVTESGLLSVVITGFIIGIRKSADIEEMKKFKLELTEIFIGFIFILLAADLNFENINKFGYLGLFLILFVLFVARPLSVFASAINTNLKFKQKIFLSWIAPRGIIAASMATLFSIRLEESGFEYSWFIETFTFMVIASTVILQGFSADYVASLLKLKEEKAKDWLIIGLHDFSVEIASFLSKNSSGECLIIDNNKKKVMAYIDIYPQILASDGVNLDYINEKSTLNFKYLLCLTDNSELNALICERWIKINPNIEAFRWDTEKENNNLAGRVLFSYLPKPSNLSTEIGKGEARISTSSHVDKHTLISLDDKGELNHKKNQKKTINLQINRKNLNLSSIISIDHIFNFDTKNFSKKELYQELSLKISQLYPFVSKEEIYSSLLKREQEQSTGIGENIALPHLHLESINSPLLFILNISNGLEWNSIDGLPVKLVFLLISPKKDPEKHLFLISRLSTAIAHSNIREKLISLTDKEKLFKTIKDRCLEIEKN